MKQNKMKKLFLFVTFLFMFSVNMMGQIQWYKTSEISMKYKKKDSGWTNWSDWEKCEVGIKMDLNNDVITIFSAKTQRYQVLEAEEPPQDSDGRQVKFYVKDQDGDYGHIRLRIDNNGKSQVYVDFSDISWVYNGVRRVEFEEFMK